MTNKHRCQYYDLCFVITVENLSISRVHLTHLTSYVLLDYTPILWCLRSFIGLLQSLVKRTTQLRRYLISSNCFHSAKKNVTLYNVYTTKKRQETRPYIILILNNVRLDCFLNAPFALCITTIIV